MIARIVRDRSLLVEVILLLGAIGAGWWSVTAAAEAWLARVAELGLADSPSPASVRAGATTAALYFSAGAAALLGGRIAGFLRSRDPIRLPLLVPAVVLACGLGLALHQGTVEVVARAGSAATVAPPTAPVFAQGFLIGAVLAAAIRAAPFDLVGLVGRLQIPIALAILAIFAGLAIAGTGPGTSGARINLGPVQPIEAVKPLFVLFLAGTLGSRASKLRWQRQRVLGLRWPRVVLLVPAVVALVAILAGLYVVGDLGPVLILSIVFLAMFYAVTRATGWVVVSVATVSGLFAIGATWPGLVNVGRVATRIRMWRDPWGNGVPHGDQLGESLWAIASGGPSGQGLGQAQTPLLAAGKTDLALATLVEQLGAAGLVLYLLLLAVIVGSALHLATRTRTPDRVLLAVGGALLLAVQWSIIQAGTFGWLPLTGVVVPFLSLGRSSMIAFVALVGLIGRVADEGAVRSESDEMTELHGSARHLAVAAAVLFLAGGALAWKVAVLDGERISAMGIATELADGTVVTRSNPRLLAMAARIRRGTIADRNGQPLAVTGSPGERRYPLGTSLGTLLGVHPSPLLLPPWALERAFDRRLRGHPTRDDGPTGRPWPDLRGFAPLLSLERDEREARLRAIDEDIASRSVTLSIDARLQRDVADILRRHLATGSGRAAAAVVMDVDSGQVLARAQVPDLDPGDRAWPARMLAREQPFLATFTGAYGAWPDKTGVQGLFQSGSVGKLFTALAAAREGQTALELPCTERDEAGPYFTRPGWPRPIHDHPRDPTHGRVGLVEGLAVSCNVYFGQLALSLGPEPFVTLHDAGADIGFGSRQWEPGGAGSRQLASTGFGQGALVMSVVQGARLVAAIGAGGRYRRCPPTLELVPQCPESSLIDDPDALVPILYGMRRVMTGGTGRSLEAPAGVRIYGKTGTADVRGFAGEEPFGIARRAYAPPHSWFLALAEPATVAEAQPVVAGRLAIAVVVPRGGTGASAAGPLAMQIAQAAVALGYLGGERSP